MAERKSNRKLLYLLSIGLIVVTVLGCVAYVQFDRMMVHVHVRRYLATSEPSANSTQWLCSHAMFSLPVLLSKLSESDATACERAGVMISKIVAENADTTNPEHTHLSLVLAAKLHQVFGQLTAVGQAQALQIAHQILNHHLCQWSPSVPAALGTAGEVFSDALGHAEAPLRELALGKLSEVWSWDGSDGAARTLVDGWKRRCYASAIESLQGNEPSLRRAAANALRFAPYHDGDDRLIALLDDPDPTVCKAALLAVAHGAADSLSSEQKTRLLEFLHHSDAEVTNAANELLINSGVSPAVVKLATLMKHPRAAERAKAVPLAISLIDDPSPWLLELAGDTSPAVRLAVARAAASTGNPRLRPTLEQMAESDPDPNVRELSKQLMATKVANRR